MLLSENKEYKYSLENFRSIAIVFVVLSHVSALELFGGIGRAVYFILGNATTWFVFITGYLFAFTEAKRRFDFRRYISKKMGFVVLPYVIFLTPTVALGIMNAKNTLLGVSPFEYVLWSFVVGGDIIGPLWFTLWWLSFTFYPRCFID